MMSGATITVSPEVYEMLNRLEALLEKPKQEIIKDALKLKIKYGIAEVRG